MAANYAIPFRNKNKPEDPSVMHSRLLKKLGVAAAAVAPVNRG